MNTKDPYHRRRSALESWDLDRGLQVDFFQAGSEVYQLVLVRRECGTMRLRPLEACLMRSLEGAAVLFRRSAKREDVRVVYKSDCRSRATVELWEECRCKE